MTQTLQTPFTTTFGALARRVVMVLICMWGTLLSFSGRALADGADQLSSAGQIWYNPSTGYVENVTTPFGGNAALPIEYVWLYKIGAGGYYQGFTPAQTGPTLSIWQVGYTPGMIVQRCARRQGCTSMLESNGATITAPSCPTITISPATLPNALQGVFYGVFTLTVSGGSSPYAWSLQSGALPPGVTWVQVGDTLEISGVPSTPGTYTFTFKATDSSNFCNGTKTYTMNVVNTNISVGDRIWNDVNKNGIQDAGEPGLSGRTVYLLDSTGTAVYQSTATDSSGYYQMDYITAGNYRIGIDLDPNRLMAPANATTDANDSDLTSVISGRWVTDVIALSATTVDVDGGLIDAADYGDLPAPYPTTGATAAYHSYDNSLRLGLEMDIESAGQPNATATGDDVAGTPDDEDAIVTFPAFTAGASATVQVSVKNSTGAVRYLNAFFDWNADGDFADAGEAIATVNVATNASQQTVNLAVPVPAGTTSGAKGARFRISPTSGLASTGVGGAGEVEDYYVTVACPTVTVSGPGSFPTGTVGTAYPSQAFTVSGGTGPYTWAISPTIPGLTISSAGVLSGAPTAAGTYNSTVSATDANNCSGTKAVTIVISACPSAIAMLAGESYTLSAAPGVVSAFWMVNTGSGANPIAGANGLTYVVTMPGTYSWIGLDTLGCVVEGCCPITFTGSMDFGDLPDLWVGTSTGNYQTLVSDSGPGHWTNGTLLRLGLTVDNESNGQPNAAASGDGVDEDGIASMPAFVRSNAFSIPVSVLNNTGSTARVFAFIDWNNDGDFLDASEAITAVAVATSASQQTVNVTGTVPAAAALGSVGARFRVSTAASLTGTGVANDGEVEDYLVTVTCPTFSWNPASLANGMVGLNYNQTVAASGGASPYTYAVTAGALPTGLSLATNTGVISGPPSAAGTFNFTITATAANGCTGSKPYSITISPALTIGNLVWADLNNNGTKDASEVGIGGVTVQLFNPGADNTANTADDVQVGSNFTTTVAGAYVFTSLAAGNYFVKVTPPSSYPKTSGTPATTDNNVDNNNDGSQPGGPGTALFSPVINLAAGAESTTDGDADANTNMTVDFGLFSGFTVGNCVWNDANANGIKDGGELGIAGLTVELLNGSGVSFSPAVTTTTNASGLYGFLVYAAGTYKVKVTPNTTYPLATVVVSTDTGIDNDSNGIQSTQGTAATSPMITLTAGGEPGTAGTTNAENTIDFGFLACPTIAALTLPDGVAGTAYNSGTGFSVTPAFGSYTWTATGLPSGFVLNNTSGIITGTTNDIGAFRVVVTATGSNGCVVTRVFPLKITGCGTTNVWAWNWDSSVDLLNGNNDGGIWKTVSLANNLATGNMAVSLTMDVGTNATQGLWFMIDHGPDPTTTDPNYAAVYLYNGSFYVTTYSNSPTVTHTLGTIITSGTYTTALSGNTRSFNFTLPVNTINSWAGGGPSWKGIGFPLDAQGNAAGSSFTPYRIGVWVRSFADGAVAYNTSTKVWTVTWGVAPDANIGTWDLVSDFGSSCCPLVVKPSTLPNGTVGTAYPTTTMDADWGIAPYTWSVSAGALPTGVTLNTTTGVLSGTPSVAGTYNFTIRAADSGTCTGTRAYTVVISCPTINVTPGSLLTSTFGTAYTQTTNPAASGISGTFTWTLGGTPPTGMTINATTGALSTTTASPVGLYSITVTATSATYTSCSGTWSGNFRVCPVITVTLPSIAATVGTAYSQTVTASGGTPAYSFAVNSGALPAWATLNPSTGVLSGTPNNTTPATFTLKATDSTGCVGISPSYTITPVCPAITVTLPSTAATVGTAYSQTVTASGGTPAYTFALNSGALPAWATLNPSTGVLSGIPNNTTPATFTLKATDSYGCVGISPSYTITPVCPTITVTPGSLLQSTFGTAYTQTTNPGASGISGTFTWAANGALPLGMTVNATTGAISTTTSTPVGLHAVSIRATSASYPSCSGVWSGNFRVCPVITVTLPSTAATVGTAYSQTVTASGGTPAYTFALNSGALPTWVTLNPSTGVLSGTPNNTTPATFTLKATDSTGCVGISPSYTITPVCPAITVTLPSIAATVGTAYSQTVTVSGGTPAYTFALNSGALPTWATLNPSTGVLSGIPNNTTPATFTLKATDSYGCVGVSPSYTITPVCPTITVTPGSLLQSTFGTAYTQTTNPIASGISGTFTWTLGGTPPAGMTINATTGALSTTTASPVGLYAITVTATSASYPSCSGTWSGNFRVCPVITVTLPSTAATVGTAYSQTVTASGGTPAYSFAVNSGALPAWATLNPSTGVLSGIPNNTTPATFTLKATDSYGCVGVSPSYTITPVCPTITVTPGSLLQSTFGTAYTQTTNPGASGISGTFTWAANGALPLGMTVNATTGAISTTTSTPVGLHAVSIRATSASYPSCSGVWSGNFRVCPIITVTLPSTAATVGTVYSQTVTASGGTPAYTFALNSGALPTWATLNPSTGVLSGTPNNTTPATFTLKATDSTGCVGISPSYTITPVCPTITVTPGSLLQSTFGTAYTQTTNPTATGISGTFTWTLGGTPPAGMTINATTGALSTTTASPVGLYAITVTATSVTYPSCSGTWSGNFRVCPVITVTLPSVAATVGTVYSQTVTASGGTPAYTFALNSGALPTWATLNPSTGVLSGTPNNTTPATFTLKATDSTGCVGVSPSYTITPVCPAITVTLPSTAATVGTAYSQTVTASGGTPAYTFALNSGALPTWATLNPSTGVLSGTPNNTTPATFTLKATDSYGCVGVSPSYTITPVCPTITVTPGSLLQSTFGTAYTQTTNPIASGISGTFTWTLGGTPPAGMTINATTGALSTTTASPVGLYAITVTATSVTYPSCSGTWSGNFRVCPVITVTLPSTAATVGTAYSQTVTASGGTPGYSFAVNSGALPAWATLNPSTGVLSGTPNNTTAATFTLKATDANGCVGVSPSYTITPVCPTITVTPGSLLQSTFGTAYTQTTNPGASGISGTFTWAANGALPLGMTVNATTGAISTTTSTPVGLHAVSIRATSASYPSCSGVWSGNFRVCPVITLAALTPTATVGTGYTSSSAASGGTASYIYSTPGPLPPGLSLSAATGQVAGTPTTTGTYNFTVNVVDANGCPGSRAQSIVVTCPTMTISPSTISDGFVNNAMSVSLSLTGGTAPFTWSINPGSLPPGLTLGGSTTAANTISGTPTTVGSYTFTVRVQDSYGCVGTQAYTVNIRSLKVGNLVWSDTNDNGLKDTGENGIAGVTVELWKAGANNLEENGAGDDSKVTTDVVTNASGIYTFINLPAGTNYYVRIPSPPLTNAITSGTPVTLDNGVDNDNNGRQTESSKPLRSPLFSLAGGTEPPLATDTDDADGELTIDFGLTPTVCVGNIVFNDVDHNGFYNTGDTLIDNVTVKIFASGADPLVAAAVGTTISSGGGVYRLCVKAGSYFLHIPPSDFGGVLSGLAPTLAPAPGPVSTLDDNADQNLDPSTKPYVFGASTGVFTLAVGGAPASAQGETGYQSTTDDAYDTNSNLTLDLGLFTMPVGAAPLAGTVRKNLTIATEGTSVPVAGVEVALYSDVNGDGQLNTTEMSAVDTAVTDASGSFEFAGVKPGEYLVVQSLPAGVEALADIDGGKADTTHVIMEGKAVNDLEFIVATSPSTYAEWQSQHEGAGTMEDGDAYDGLMEYALGTSPDLADAKPHFWVECNARGGADALMIRPTNGLLDLIYRLEGSSDLKKWKPLSLAPAVTTNDDGTETVRYVDVVAPFVRLVVELDADHNGTAEASSISPGYGWTHLKLAAASQTFSMPLMKAPIYTGSLNASTGVRFDKGLSYYAEIIAGEGAGRCFEINEASSGSSGIVFDGEQPEAGAKVAVRAHWTVAELFPVGRFEAAANVDSADRVMFFDGKDYHVLWLKALESGARWVREGDATGADAGSTIIGPTEGLLVHPRTSAVTLPLSGEVRTWAMPARVTQGSRLIGSGSALTQSPVALGWKLGSAFHAGEDAVTSDRLLVWDGDSQAGASAYTAYFFIGDATQADWKDASGSVVSGRDLVQSFRAVMLVRPQTLVTK